MQTPINAVPSTEPIRIALASSERVTRAGLRMLIDSHSALRVIGEVERPGAGLGEVAEGPHILLVDIDGPDGLDFVPTVRDPDGTRSIILTSTPDSDACSSAILRGVMGLVPKQEGPDVLIKAIQRVHAGEVWMARARIAGVLGDLRIAARNRRQGGKNPLQPRERQIITLVGQGFRNAEIAATIFVSEATVRNALGAIFKKLGVANRVHLMAYAIREGFVTLPSVRGSVSPRGILRLATVAGRPLDEEMP
jgi:DNA-binding NarL/FixJ family response regulator